MNFRLRLRVDGHWELSYKGSVTAAGRRWDEDVATLLHRGMKTKYAPDENLVLNEDIKAELAVAGHIIVEELTP